MNIKIIGVDHDSKICRRTTEKEIESRDYDVIFIESYFNNPLFLSF